MAAMKYGFPPRHEVDGASVKSFERFLEAEVAIEQPRGVGVEFDQKVEVAALRVERIRGRRTEKLQPRHAVAPAEFRDFVEVGGKDIGHDG